MEMQIDRLPGDLGLACHIFQAYTLPRPCSISFQVASKMRSRVSMVIVRYLVYRDQIGKKYEASCEF